jgi:hypothetical protein
VIVLVTILPREIHRMIPRSVFVTTRRRNAIALCCIL